MRTSCCLNLPPPTSNPAPKASIIPLKPPQVSLAKTEGNWRRQCVMVGVASYCTIIGLELSTSSSLAHEAVAEEIMRTSVASNNSSLVSVAGGGGGGGGGGAKWSEKRACPPWRGNSLETIVPENLPRPAARRRYEAVRSTSKTAPPLLSGKVILRSNKESCFSM